MIPATNWHPELPNVVVSGEYTATFENPPNPWPTWLIRRRGVLVGEMWCSNVYDKRRGQFCWSLNKLVWAGPFPEGYPKNPDAALVFDGGPFDNYQTALDRFAAQANALIAWREKNK
jgi:hypothetical protein